MPIDILPYIPIKNKLGEGNWACRKKTRCQGAIGMHNSGGFPGSYLERLCPSSPL